MKNSRGVLIFLFSSILLIIAGCASNVVPYRNSSSIITTPEKGSVTVFWRRMPEQDLFIYPIPAEILVDGKSVGNLRVGSHGSLALKLGQRKIQIQINKDYPIPNFFATSDFEEVILIEPEKEAVLIFEWKAATSQFNPGLKRLIKTRTVTEDVKKSNNNFVYIEP